MPTTDLLNSLTHIKEKYNLNYDCLMNISKTNNNADFSLIDYHIFFLAVITDKEGNKNFDSKRTFNCIGNCNQVTEYIIIIHLRRHWTHKFRRNEIKRFINERVAEKLLMGLRIRQTDKRKVNERNKWCFRFTTTHTIKNAKNHLVVSSTLWKWHFNYIFNFP